MAQACAAIVGQPLCSHRFVAPPTFRNFPRQKIVQSVSTSFKKLTKSFLRRLLQFLSPLILPQLSILNLPSFALGLPTLVLSPLFAFLP